MVNGHKPMLKEGETLVREYYADYAEGPLYLWMSILALRKKGKFKHTPPPGDVRYFRECRNEALTLYHLSRQGLRFKP